MSNTIDHFLSFHEQRSVSPTEIQIHVAIKTSGYFLDVQGVSAKTWRYIKTFIEQSRYLKSGHLYSYFNDSCLLTKTKLPIETF